MSLSKKKCVPCEGGTTPLNETQENLYLQNIPQWSIRRSNPHAITRTVVLKNFKDALELVNKVADIAEREGHHPNITIVWNKVTFELYTHAIGGLSENDFIIAAMIDEVTQKS